MNLNPKRLDNENFDDYKNRMRIVNRLLKIYLRGKPIRNTRKELFNIKHNVL